MANKQKRITVTQFDTALLEQVTHARNMNIPTNSVSSAAAFVLMVRKRLYGEVKLLEATNNCISRLMTDAKAERAQYELEQQERERLEKSRIVLPGDARFRN